MPFHIAVVHPAYPQVFEELAQLLTLSLQSLGHEVTRGNKQTPGATNIVIGYTAAERLDDAIAFQLEPLKTEDPRFIWDYVEVAQRAGTVWDYSASNVAFLKQHDVTNVRHVPLGYHPGLHTIPRRTDEPLDILFYGIGNPDRFPIYQQLKQFGRNVRFVENAWGRARDELIASAKVVLNLRMFPGQQLQQVRISHLLNNARFVLSETMPENIYDVPMADREELVATAIRYAQDDAARELERQAAFERFKQMPMTEIVAVALALR
jgi:hypothetical protein